MAGMTDAELIEQLRDSIGDAGQQVEEAQAEARLAAAEAEAQTERADGAERAHDRLADALADMGKKLTETERERDEARERAGNVLAAAKWVLTTSADDWGATSGKAWLYGIFVGWACEDEHDHDDICGGQGALDEAIEQHRWSPSAVQQVLSLRNTVRALDGKEARRG